MGYWYEKAQKNLRKYSGDRRDSLTNGYCSDLGRYFQKKFPCQELINDVMIHPDRIITLDTPDRETSYKMLRKMACYKVPTFEPQEEPPNVAFSLQYYILYAWVHHKSINIAHYVDINPDASFYDVVKTVEGLELSKLQEIYEQIIYLLYALTGH